MPENSILPQTLQKPIIISQIRVVILTPFPPEVSGNAVEGAGLRYIWGFIHIHTGLNLFTLVVPWQINHPENITSDFLLKTKRSL